MTKIFVPLFVVAALAFGTVNAQKPAPAVKKVAPPVNKMPVPVARPVVPVAKPAAPVVAKPAAPAPAPVAAPKPVAPVAKPAAPAPVAAKPVAPVAKPVAPVAKPAAPVAAKPEPVKKAPAISKAPVKKAAVAKHTKPAHTASPVTAPVAMPTRDEAVSAPKPYVPEKPVTRVIEKEETETESSNAPCSGSYHSINGCTCYKDAPDDCVPWKFRNRRYYRYTYTLEHYRNHKHENCCAGGHSCHHTRHHYRHSCH